MKRQITSMFGIALIAAMASSSMTRLAQAAPYVEIRPVDPLGTGVGPYPAGTTIDGDHMTIVADSRVWLDIYVGAWAPEELKSGQVGIDPAGYSSGDGAPLLQPIVACPDPGTSYSPTCEAALGVRSSCEMSSVCNTAFLDYDRSPPIASGLIPFAIQTDSPPLRVGFSTIDESVPDTGVPLLIGSFALDVPADAFGTYTLAFLRDGNTFMNTTSETFDASQLGVMPATITVVRSGPCCLPSGMCMDLEAYMCLDAGGTSTDHCWGDCDGDGIDDGCEGALDCNGNNVPDFCDVSGGVSADCNHNGVPDECDVAAGADDCNADNIPDECELGPNDCDGNGIPDDCQSQDDCDGNGALDVCELAAGNAADCNGNGVLDACDINAGTSTDANGDCIPDECDATAGPVAEVNGHPENRFLSFSTAGAGCRDMAIRVEMVSLRPAGRGDDFAAFEGKWRWLGPPVLKTYVVNNTPEYDMMTQLQCDPYVQDWSTAGMVHAYGAEVMPESTYAVSFYDASCGDVNNPSCYSNELVVHTAKWADLAPQYDGETTAVEPDFNDVAAVVERFRGASWPTHPEADLAPNIPNLDYQIDYSDIATAVDAFLGVPYPFAGPVSCPVD